MNLVQAPIKMINEQQLNSLIAFRRELHQFPEVSENEFETQRRIVRRLKGAGIENVFCIAKTGVLVRFDGKEPGKTIMLRADTDALPIIETNDFDHKSTDPGVSHKCGHDGHTTIMMGVAEYLIANPLKKGTVVLLFQPGEENGYGAKAVLEDSNFNFEPDMVFALHNLPGYPMHQVVVKEGSFTAAAKSIIIKLFGKTAHAAEPEMGINPAACMSELVQLFEKVNQPDLEKDDFTLTAPVYMNMGEKSYGVTAGYGEVHYTLRTWNNKTMDYLTHNLVHEISQLGLRYRLKTEISWAEEFASNQNDVAAVDLIRKAASDNQLNIEERSVPFKWGEDFGLFTERFSGAMFGIGSGKDCPALHNPDYDFPDEIIVTGVKMFTSLIERVTNE